MEESNGEDMGGSDRGASPPPARTTFDCGDAMDGRCRLYAALPSFLLAMNGFADRDDRLTAARDANGAWARIDVADGRWTADSSTLPDLAYDRRRHGAQAGIDAEVADGARVGVSVHGFRGVAALSGAGRAALSGMGMGVYAAAPAGGGFRLDARAAATWYDVDLTSAIHPRPLASGVSGTGQAVGVEVGRPVAAAPGVSLTPRAGLVWSRVSLDDFTDSVGSRARVSMARAKSLRAGVGMTVEAALGGSGNDRLFAAVDAMREFSAETETVVEGQALKASAEPVSVRFRLGGSFDLDGRATLRAAAGYETGGGGNHAFSGGLTLAIRF